MTIEIVLEDVVTIVGTTFYLVIEEDAAAEEMTMSLERRITAEDAAEEMMMFLEQKTTAEEDTIEEMTTCLVWETTEEDAVAEEMTMFLAQETTAEEDAETAAGSGNLVKGFAYMRGSFFLLCKDIKSPLN
jgi:type IV secretory pathway VirB4 component